MMPSSSSSLYFITSANLSCFLAVGTSNGRLTGTGTGVYLRASAMASFWRVIFSSSGPVIWSFWAYRLGLSLSRQPPQMKPSFTLVLMRWIFLPHIAHISAIFIGGGFDMHHLNCCLSIHRRCRTVSSNRLT